VFDGNALDKSTEITGPNWPSSGYPFAQATTRITRDAGARRIGVALVIDQGPRTLCRAHRNPRQYANPRLCDSA